MKLTEEQAEALIDIARALAYKNAVDDCIKILSNAYAQTKARVDGSANDQMYHHYDGAKCAIELLLDDVQQLKDIK